MDKMIKEFNELLYKYGNEDFAIYEMSELNEILNQLDFTDAVKQVTDDFNYNSEYFFYNENVITSLPKENVKMYMLMISYRLILEII